MTAPLFFCGELDSIIPSSNAVVESTTAGRFDPAWSRCSILLPISTSARPIPFASQQSMFLHFDLFGLTATPIGDIVYFFNSVGGTVAKLAAAGTDSGPLLLQLFVLIGGVLTAVGTQAIVPASTLNQIDIQLNIATGAANLFVAGSLQSAATVSFAAVSNFASVEFVNLSLAAQFNISQVIGHTLSTVSMRLQTLVEDSNGPNQDWTGTVGNINELPLNDATGITSASANQVSDYFDSTASITGNIIGVGTSARFNVGATGPQNLENVLNVGGTVFTGSSFAGSTGFQVAQFMWDVNPATSAAWTAGAAEAASFGVKSLT